MSAASRATRRLGTAGDLPAETDLLAVWRPDGFLMERGGAGVVTAGELRRIDVAEGPDQAGRAASLAEAALAGVGGGRAVVVGALPFRGDTPARLTLPERVVVTSIGPRDLDLGAGELTRQALEPWGSVFQTATGAPDGPVGRAHPHPHFPAFPAGWRAEPSAGRYAQAVAEAIARIRAGELEKVVLARSLVAANRGLEIGTLLAELRRRDPDCHLFATPAGAGATFVGATPETLVRREGERVLSLPHAGTAPRSSDPAEDRRVAAALLGSAKDLHEHAAVVEAIADGLAPHCAELRVDPAPHLTATGAVWHLATAVRGRLRAGAPSALGLAAALHPTPAVCGTPTAAAAALISRLEHRSRGLYAGLVGWVDGRGDGEWAVSLRCALISAGEVRIHAGAGIVGESMPHLEVAETEVKFRTIVDALEAGAEPAGPRG